MVDFDQPDASGRAVAAGPRNVRRQQPAEPKEEPNIQGPCDAFTYACTGDRVFGMGFCGRLCDNDLDPGKYDELLKTVKPHRSYFTYW